jgi:hypothetical protein
MREKESDVIEMLIRHELAIKQLYEIFAATFPNHKDFWQGLAGDEQRHADWLEIFHSKETLGKLLLFDGRLKSQAIKASIGYVEKLIVRAQEDRCFSLLEALSIAKDLETALLEKQFSKICDTDSAQIRSVWMDLAAETEKHRKAIVEALSAEKR